MCEVFNIWITTDIFQEKNFTIVVVSAIKTKFNTVESTNLYWKIVYLIGSIVAKLGEKKIHLYVS